MTHELQQELALAERAARQAGLAILSCNDRSAILYKQGNEGPVTAADLAADAIITGALTQHFPMDTLVSEESAPTSLPPHGRIWLVDPLDGTSDYVAGGNDFSVMIGLLEGGHPILGIVYDPVRNVLWRAVNTVAMKYAERVDADGSVHRLQVHKRELPLLGPRFAISRHHPSKIVDFMLSTLGPIQTIIKGSIGLKIGLIVDNEADMYVTASHHIKVWDTCAPMAILLGAGGVMSTLDGEVLRYTTDIRHHAPFIASTPKGFRAIVPKLRDAVFRINHGGT